MPHTARDAKWFGFPPASDEEISTAERRLDIPFPDDLREFYRTTNGWMLCGATIYDIMPVQELCWLSTGDPDLWSICEVNPLPPKESGAAYEDWYDQGIKVCRSLMLNTRGDDARLLYDPEPAISAGEQRYGTWAAWHPAMQWRSNTLLEFFEQQRATLSEMGG